MKWIEIIELRSLKNETDKIKQELRGPFSETDKKNGLKEIRLYYHMLVETDLSIHFYWEHKENKPGKSSLGLRLASAIGELGRVNHSIWIEG